MWLQIPDISEKIAVLTTIVICVLFFPFRETRAKLDLQIHYGDRMTVVEMIRNGELLPEDDLGNIVLPDEYRRLSDSGEVFQYQNDEEGQVICFWVSRGAFYIGCDRTGIFFEGMGTCWSEFPVCYYHREIGRKMVLCGNSIIENGK